MGGIRKLFHQIVLCCCGKQIALRLRDVGILCLSRLNEKQLAQVGFWDSFLDLLSGPSSWVGFVGTGSAFWALGTCQRLPMFLPLTT